MPSTTHLAVPYVSLVQSNTGPSSLFYLAQVGANREEEPVLPLRTGMSTRGKDRGLFLFVRCENRFGSFRKLAVSCV